MDDLVVAQGCNPFICPACVDIETGKLSPLSMHIDGNMKLYTIKVNQKQYLFRKAYHRGFWMIDREDNSEHMKGLDRIYNGLRDSSVRSRHILTIYPEEVDELRGFHFISAFLWTRRMKTGPVGAPGPL